MSMTLTGRKFRQRQTPHFHSELCHQLRSCRDFGQVWMISGINATTEAQMRLP